MSNNLDQIAALEQATSYRGLPGMSVDTEEFIPERREMALSDVLRHHTSLYDNYMYDLIYGTKAAVNLDQVPDFITSRWQPPGIYKTNIPLPSKEDVFKRALDNLALRDIPLNEYGDLSLDIK